MRQLALCLSVALLVGFLPRFALAQTSKLIAPPKLVVLLAVDGLPYWQALAYRDQLLPDGLARLIDKAAWFEDAHHRQARTVTAVGHASMLTGAYPDQTGIIGNDWRDVLTDAPVYCTGDTAHSYIGHPTLPLDGTSPKNLRVLTLGDMLRLAKPQAKVVAISGKDRGAILPAGHLGTAYMYMKGSGQFASTSYYMKSHPAWVDAFHASKPADAWVGAQWTQAKPDAAYARSLASEQTGYKSAVTLPITFGVTGEAPGKRFYESILASPFVDDLSLQFARAAIKGERLGQRGTTDLLAISLSGHDYVNHAHSAESRLSHDHLLQLDRLFAAFFKHLDQTIGSNNHVLVFTSDHGFAPNPERSAGLGLPSGRFSTSAMLANVNAALTQRFGPPPNQALNWVSLGEHSLVVNKRAVASLTQPSQVEVAAAARDLLLLEPPIDVAYTRQELASNSRAGERYFESHRKTWHAQLSGDVQYSVKPYWMAGQSVATHGSPHPYDSHVPLAFYGPKWIKAQLIAKPAAVVDIAPTLAEIMGIEPPRTSVGQVLKIRR